MRRERSYATHLRLVPYTKQVFEATNASKSYGVHTNPKKSEQVVFAAEDKIIVIAEDCPDPHPLWYLPPFSEELQSENGGRLERGTQPANPHLRR